MENQDYLACIGNIEIWRMWGLLWVGIQEDLNSIYLKKKEKKKRYLLCVYSRFYPIQISCQEKSVDTISVIV
jgi:hypothetical protein